MNPYDFFRKRLLDLRASYLAKQYDISGFKRIYFVHIRKCGGTSLNKMFLALADPNYDLLYNQLVDAPRNIVIKNGLVFVGWNEHLINKGHYFYAFSHTPIHKLSLPPATFTVTCFRDPIKRVISHYKMLLSYKLNNVKHPCMEIEGKWLGSSFSDFIKKVPQEHLANQLYMFSRAFDLDEAIQVIRDRVCYYFFTDEFVQGIEELNRILSLSLVPLHEKRTDISIEVTDEDLAYLRNKLSREYEMLSILRKGREQFHARLLS